MLAVRHIGGRVPRQKRSDYQGKWKCDTHNPTTGNFIQTRPSKVAAASMVALPKSREPFLRLLGVLLLAVPFLSASWVQTGSESATPAPPFLSDAEITSQLSYSCPSNTACSFVCPGRVGAGGLGASSCQVNGLTLEDYVGRLPSRRLHSPQMSR
jgi:hypothetical protein